MATVVSTGGTAMGGGPLIAGDLFRSEMRGARLSGAEAQPGAVCACTVQPKARSGEHA